MNQWIKEWKWFRIRAVYIQPSFYSYDLIKTVQVLQIISGKCSYTVNFFNLMNQHQRIKFMNRNTFDTCAHIWCLYFPHLSCLTSLTISKQLYVVGLMLNHASPWCCMMRMSPKWHSEAILPHLSQTDGIAWFEFYCCSSALIIREAKCVMTSLSMHIV